LTGRTFDDIIDSQDHFGCFRSTRQYLQFTPVTFHDFHFVHIPNCSIDHIESITGVSCRMCRSQLRDQFGRIVSTIIGNNLRELQEGLAKGGHGQGFLPGCLSDGCVNGVAHEDFGAATSVDTAGVFQSGSGNTEGVVQGAFGFVQNVGTAAAKDNSTGGTGFAPSQAKDLGFSNKNLFQIRIL
jgi:hypothetical protein